MKAGSEDKQIPVSGVTEGLWTAERVAKFLGIPVATIYAWRYKGEGPRAFRIGKHLRFYRGDVESWLAMRRD